MLFLSANLYCFENQSNWQNCVEFWRINYENIAGKEKGK